MAYHQNQHDHYYAAPGNDSYYATQNNGYAYNSVRPAIQPSETDHQWDAKSFQSSYSGSQVALTPSVIPPLPSPQIMNYPPSRPPAFREQSSGYSVAREKLMHRRSVRQVALFKGNLVVDVQVPSHIIPKHLSDVEEMTKMRYTAATCDPDDFMRSKYLLRQYLYNRQTELFIVMTMYNEDEVLFVKTMNAVIKNIAHLCGRSRSKTWGPDGWKKVVVCIVSDGRSKINKRTLQVLSLVSTGRCFSKPSY
jgi:chitin synthase